MAKSNGILSNIFSKISNNFNLDNLFSVSDVARVESNFQTIADGYKDIADPFGLDLSKTKEKIKLLLPIYRNYFKVRVINPEFAQTDRPLMVVSNHSGQIPIDAMLITMAFVTDITPPRLLRSMVERFVTSVPFFGTWVAESGAVLGDRSNCQWLLERDQSILVFPEGVRGVSKSTSKYYQVQKFTSGFFRLALHAGVDILPISVIGAEEFYPLVYHPWSIAKSLNLPALPLSASFLLGPIGMIPLPSPVDIRVGEIYSIPKNIETDAPDEAIDFHVKQIQNKIQEMIDIGLKERRDFFGAINK